MLALRPIGAVAWQSPHQLTATKIRVPITQRCNNRLMHLTISDLRLYNTITQRFSKSLEGLSLKVARCARSLSAQALHGKRTMRAACPSYIGRPGKQPAGSKTSGIGP